jgi:hypothetical protein
MPCGNPVVHPDTVRPGFSNRYKYFPLSGFGPGTECEISEEDRILLFQSKAGYGM